jgi:hypothetical protein
MMPTALIADDTFVRVSRRTALSARTPKRHAGRAGVVAGVK